MTPRDYWIGWSLMALGWLLSLTLACWYLGAKLDAVREAIRGL